MTLDDNNRSANGEGTLLQVEIRPVEATDFSSVAGPTSTSLGIGSNLSFLLSVRMLSLLPVTASEHRRAIERFSGLSAICPFGVVSDPPKPAAG
jgi:hypothetical protein